MAAAPAPVVLRCRGTADGDHRKKGFRDNPRERGIARASGGGIRDRAPVARAGEATARIWQGFVEAADERAEGEAEQAEQRRGW